MAPTYRTGLLVERLWAHLGVLWVWQHCRDVIGGCCHCHWCGYCHCHRFRQKLPGCHSLVVIAGMRPAPGVLEGVQILCEVWVDHHHCCTCWRPAHLLLLHLERAESVIHKHVAGERGQDGRAASWLLALLMLLFLGATQCTYQHGEMSK